MVGAIFVSVVQATCKDVTAIWKISNTDAFPGTTKAPLIVIPRGEPGWLNPRGPLSAMALNWGTE